MKKLTKVGTVFTLGLFALGSFFINKAEAQVVCGSIYYPDEYDGYTENIEDCDNPFNGTVKIEPDLLFEGQTLEPGDDLSVGELDWGLLNNDFASLYQTRLFRKVAENQYEFIRTFNYGNNYTKVDSGLFTQAELFALENRFYFIEKGESVNWSEQSRVNPSGIPDYAILMINEFEQEYAYRAHLFKTGDYVLVMEKPDIGDPQLGINYIFKWLLGTKAQAAEVGEIIVVPFTVNGGLLSPEPEGASSVLFLPGIQASRLYTDGLFGTEDQLWEPNSDADVEALGMSLSGQSLNDIYTRDVIDEVNVTPVGQGNIYKGLIDSIEELVLNETIVDFETFAYDWRFSVADIVEQGTRYENEVRNLIVTVEELAELSHTGKITLIGHSNGGLVAKALINELKTQNKDNLVDKVIFIGTPHLGTPKAIATILHGYDQQKLGGAIIDDRTARDVMNNMPGAYGLLPSERYLSMTDSALISFEDSSSTRLQFETFGAEIENLNEYRNFLGGIEGRINEPSNISAPYRTNTLMLMNALGLHNELDHWEAPSPISVFNLVGTGLMTIDSIQYREIVEMITCTGNIFGQITCNDPDRFMRPYAKFSAYGDETVTALSAETVEGETFYFDFKELDQATFLPIEFSHADFTEINEVQDFVLSIISSSTVPDSIPYISNTKATYNEEYEITAIDSPVRVVKEDGEGNQTGVIIQNGNEIVVKEIPGSDYFEMGGTKYVIVPKEAGLATTLYGEAYGSYTMTVATLRNGNEQVVDNELINATTTPTMIATYELTQNGYTNIQTDYDGNGVVDMETTLDGEVIAEEPEVTLETLRAQIISLNLKKIREAPLLVILRLVEQTEKLKAKPAVVKHIHDKLLRQLSDTIKLYKKKGWISEGQYNSLINSINYLLNK